MAKKRETVLGKMKELHEKAMQQNIEQEQEQENKISEEEKMENEIGQTRLVEDKQDKEQEKEKVEPVHVEQVENDENNITSILEQYKNAGKGKPKTFYLPADTAKKIELLSKEYGVAQSKIISLCIEREYYLCRDKIEGKKK